jgi:nucleotide-binding universal stress UspA family protein
LAQRLREDIKKGIGGKDMYSKLLVPLDGSKAAEQVLPYARLLTSAFKKPVELLAVNEIAEILAYASPSMTAAAFDMVQKGQREIEVYLQTLAGTLGADQVECSVDQGRVAEVILDRATADPAMMIAMASHGRSGLNRWMLGSVAEKVLRGTANPLLLVRASEHSEATGVASLKSIIVPLDGSGLAETVLPIVAATANRLNLSVELFRAFDLPYILYDYRHGYYGADVTQYRADLHADMRKYLEDKVEEVRALGIANVSYVASEGLGADEIIRFGHTTPESLIAMCSHGRSGITRWTLGSVAETVARHSDKPMLILRPAVRENG